jgi:outer membrane immunogenic protein
MGAQTFNGWFLGGGTEVAMPSWPGLTWKTEYRYASYSSQDGNAICATAGCGGVGTVHSVNTLRPYVQTIRSSLVWRFNFR